ncbi:beta-glucosidase-like glycosyl hydrolase [Xenococcus sp. PCC 7305]|uniref:glycoside hydrolase family 3 N-terminal domain-containing protein n=1 Tax=Xenococcus sp. PCC 7305 TaxID=102125 RepID=UPI0002AC47C7|nr:glycoside hydrolase family 3 N-terminal domain-containing protein [Xenococcus sp. PCC 7305]ELS01534.1 beta-glucosidase-like glycosyl hydrolase [Xenococcus sp. PCC 7305]
MNLRAKIGQMIIVRASGYLFDHQRRYPAWEADNQTLERWLTELNLGGVILLGGSAIEVKTRSQQLQSWAKIPLFIAADIEEGVGQRFPGATWFAPPMALSAIAAKDLNLSLQYAKAMGKITAQEAIAIGINWLLAPVVDVNNNPDNPVINIRAFGQDAQIVSHLTRAFIEGAKSHPILTTAKHFPGHGDTATDSHLDLPNIPHDNSRLNRVELPPFVNAIASGVDSVMSAHLTIPAWDKDYPATLSKKIMTGKLRAELGFDGLIITDALIMGGVTKYATAEEIAVLAVTAGADILLMPEDPEIAIESIYQAVRSQIITEERIEQSLERIEQAKLGLVDEFVEEDKRNSLEFQSSTELLSAPQHRQIAQDILRDSGQTGGNLPLTVDDAQAQRNLIVVDDVLNCSFLDLAAPAIAIPQKFGYQRQILDQNSLEQINHDQRKTLLQVFIRGNPFRGTAGLTQNAIAQYKLLLTSENLAGLIIYGSPYVKDWFISQLAIELPWVFVYGQMNSAQAVAMQSLFNLESNTESATKITNNFGF